MSWWRRAEDRPQPPREKTRGNGVEAGALLEGFAEPVLILDGYRVAQANAAAHALLGERLAGQDMRLVLRQPEAIALLGSAEGGSAMLHGLGGPQRRFELRVAPLQMPRRLVQLTDRSTDRLAEKMRTDFVANASHELRTPLATISGFIETLLDDEAGADHGLRRRFLAIMAREAHRMERLIEDLMSLSRVEADKYVRPDARVALDTLVARVVREVSAAGGAVIQPEIEAGITVAGDEAQLSQLLHNLLDNARRHGGGREVAVRLSRENGQARLEVADQGPGVDPKHLPRLTERFYRVDAARSRDSGGTGLGLAIVKHIVERHRGEMGLESKPGEGLKVTVTLPVVHDLRQGDAS